MGGRWSASFLANRCSRRHCVGGLLASSSFQRTTQFAAGKSLSFFLFSFFFPVLLLTFHTHGQVFARCYLRRLTGFWFRQPASFRARKKKRMKRKKEKKKKRGKKKKKKKRKRKHRNAKQRTNNPCAAPVFSLRRSVESNSNSIAALLACWAGLARAGHGSL